MLAVEGVSHSLCLVWHAIAERPLSQLALELQAEVDKFIVGRAQITRQHGLRAAAPLHHWLFARSRLRPLLSGESRRRYAVAGRLAADYCQRLHRAAALAPLPPAAELRRFSGCHHLKSCVVPRGLFRWPDIAKRLAIQAKTPYYSAALQVDLKTGLLASPAVPGPGGRLIPNRKEKPCDTCQ